MWRRSKQVECAACNRLLVDMGTVLQYRDELSQIGPVLTSLAGRGDSVVMPNVQHFALQQLLASLTAKVANHEDATLELERQVATLETGFQSLNTKAKKLGKLLSESLSVVEDRVQVMHEDLKNKLERRTAEITSELQRQTAQGMVRFSAFDDAVINEFRDAKLKFQEVVRKLNVFTERTTNLEQWEDKMSGHLNACFDRVTNLEQ